MRSDFVEEFINMTDFFFLFVARGQVEVGNLIGPIEVEEKE